MADSPPLLPTSSSSRLILLPDTDDRDPLQEYSTDEEDDNEDNNAQHGINQLLIPPLSSSVVFLYLLAPYLRLGAIYVSDIGGATLGQGLRVGALLVAASLSNFCRQLWFLLGRYVRKSSTEDIFVHMIARRHRSISHYGWARYTFTAISGLFQIILAAMYMRDSVDSVLLLKLPEFVPSCSSLNVSVLLCIVVFVLSLPRSLASNSIIYTTGLSVASYVIWLVAFSSYGTSTSSLQHPSSFRQGVLWNEASSLVFACSTAMTVPLAASLAARTTSVSPSSRNARARKFQLLNLLSTVLAALLILPLVILATSPRAPTSVTTTDNIILSLRIATLVLSVPSIVVSITCLPLPGLASRFIRTDLALSVIVAMILACSLVPPIMASTLGDVMLFSAVFGGLLLPALAHITIHYFRRPLSIVVPHRPSSAPTSPRASTSDRSPSPSRDSLLQRKERHLQRRRFGKRLMWDIVNWIVLVPLCICMLVWAIGRVARRW